MRPTSPVLEGFDVPEVKFAETQEEYQTLPAVRTDDGLVVSRWEMTDEEAVSFSNGEADLFLFVWLTTCPRCGEMQPLTPMLPEITTAQEIMDRANMQKALAAPGSNGHGAAKAAKEFRKAAPPAPEALPPPSDEEIAMVFRQVWSSAIGTPGYRERRWQHLRELLDRRGIKV